MLLHKFIIKSKIKIPKFSQMADVRRFCKAV